MPLAADYANCYRARIPPMLRYLYTTDHPWLRLDYIFASQELAPRLRMGDLCPGRARLVAPTTSPTGQS